MKSDNPSKQQRELAVAEQEHAKESTELTADISSGAVSGSSIVLDSTSSSNTATNEFVAGTSDTAADAADSTTVGTAADTTASETPLLDQTAYENQFIQQPIGGESTTTSSLFPSGLNVFSPTSIATKPHYLSSSITGQLWLDVDRNGKRGSFIDPTLNAAEQDSGVTGVDAIVLVDCDTNTEVAVTKSQPVRGDGQVVIQKATETSGRAGGYNFPEVMNRPGRYYIVYKAPMGFRINSNVLPMVEVKAEKSEETGTLSYFECPLMGGEGGMFYEDAVENGEFDYGGYCGRSVGCFEVGRKRDLVDKFENLIEVDEGTGEELYGLDDMVVAYPSQHMLDVGLAEQEWPLNTQQYADIAVDLLFLENSTEAVLTSLGEALDSDSALAESSTALDIKRSLLDTVRSIEGFSDVKLEVEDVAVMSLEEEHKKVSEESSPTSDIFSRNLRSSSRKLQVSEEPPALNGYTAVTYKFMVRGEYNPPPRRQLGEIAEQSINRDSRKLTETLRDRIDPFAGLQDVNSKVLSIKGYEDSVAADSSAEIRPPPLDTLNALNAESRSGLADWATVPIILLAISISGLVGLFFFRRAFSRRKVVNEQDLKKDELFNSACDHADEEAAAKSKEDPMDNAVSADKAEDVPANMRSSGTDGSSGADSSDRRRRKPRSSRSRAREVASSLKRSLTLHKQESILSDISDHEERRKKRKKAKREARRLESEREDDENERSDRSRNSNRPSRKSSRRSSRRSSEFT